MRGRFLTAAWHDLAMLNYEVDPAVLRARVPRGVELDDLEGRHLVSVVGFRFLDTRVLGVPIPFHRDFDEVNLRFYVRRSTPEGWRRGVVFVKELVPRFAIAAVARWLYGENYESRPMRHHREATRLGYGWRIGGDWEGLELRTRGEARLPAEGSEPRFITEHYWGYSRQRDGSTVEYQVEHPPWRVWATEEARLEAEVGRLYGAEFVEALSGPPRSAFVADGSAIVVRKGQRLTRG